MGTIMALRNDILKPGGYASVPHCVLKSSRLASCDKLVYQVLLDYLGGNDSVWPSQAMIARRTALSIRGVRRSVARLTEIGLISCEVIAGTSNHYTFSDPEVVLNTHAEADSVSDLSQRGGGHAVRTNPVTVADEPLHVTTSLEPPQGNTSVEPPHSPACGGPQPAATESEIGIHSDLLQGVRDMNRNVESFRSLLTAWIKQKRTPPSPDKIKVCLNLLKIQQEQTGEILDPAAVQDCPLEFTELFQRAESGKYRWQLLQGGENASNPPAQNATPQSCSTTQIEEIYQVYPRRVGRAAALKAIQLAVKRMQSRDANEDAVAFLMERTKLFAASPAGNKGRFTPYPATWFNQERYLDDEQEWNATENRSGNLKREIVEETETPGESFQDIAKRITKK
jgi:hypothetical protein